MEMVINSEKISRFSRCHLRPGLCVFLRDIGGKIAGISQCRPVGTTLLRAGIHTMLVRIANRQDDSFEYSQHIFWLRNRKINFLIQINS